MHPPAALRSGVGTCLRLYGTSGLAEYRSTGARRDGSPALNEPLTSSYYRGQAALHCSNRA